MSYLSSPASTTNFGVVEIGNNIVVSNGVISLIQDISPNGSPTFNNVTVLGNLVSNGLQVVTTVNPTAGAGIVITDGLINGPTASFQVTNNGVVSVSGSNGIVVSGSTGNVVITNTGVTNLVGNVGILLSSAAGNVVVTNSGVTELLAGTGISLSSATGNITISSAGTSVINTIGVTGNYTATATDDYIGVSSNSAVTITIPSSSNGRMYYIKNESISPNCKITVLPASGLIDNQASYLINVPYEAINIIARAGNWYII